MRERKYYSVRNAKNESIATLDLPMLRRLFRDAFTSFLSKDYFQEAFGYSCVDAGDVPGFVGEDIPAFVFLKLRKDNIWPVSEKCLEYSEEDLFDAVELLFDLVSKPVEGHYHSYSNCGWHYTKFDQRAGQEEFRAALNQLLADYDRPHELSEDGELLMSAGAGLAPLFQAAIPHHDHLNVNDRIAAAVLKYRRRGSTVDDRRDAVRDLADVLEFLRPQAQAVLSSKDESDLFNLANNFGIRHHNTRQKTEYDKAIWMSWMFYYYLATIHACIRLIERQGGAQQRS